MYESSMTLIGSGGSTSKRQTKAKAILKVLLSGATLNRFEAESYADHCLHSTISGLERYGLVFGRRWERVPCMRGTSTVRCKRYWLSQQPENLNRARLVCAAVPGA